MCGDKAGLRNTLSERYDWRIPIELTHGDQSFTLIARSHKRKSAEFIPPIRVASLADTRGVNPENIRIRGASGDLLFDPARTISRKTRIPIVRMGHSHAILKF